MLTRTALYALRITVVLARADGEPITSERVAQITRVPPDYAVKVLQMLSRAGIVGARRGRGGGFHLLGPAESTDLAAVVDAVGGLHPPGAPDDAFEDADLIALDETMADVEEAVRSRLAATSLAELTESRRPAVTIRRAGVPRSA